MTDIKLKPYTPPAGPLFLRDEELRRGIELMMFAYRYFTLDADHVLDSYHYGRAHHRVLHFIASSPGMPVAELLRILGITKQSLSRVLGQLIEEGFVRQQQGARDRRQRLLYLTDRGAALESELSERQRARVAAAYREAGPEAVAGFWKVLANLIDEPDRAGILDFITRK